MSHGAIWCFRLETDRSLLTALHDEAHRIESGYYTTYVDPTSSAVGSQCKGKGKGKGKAAGYGSDYVPQNPAVEAAGPVDISTFGLDFHDWLMGKDWGWTKRTYFSHHDSPPERTIRQTEGLTGGDILDLAMERIDGQMASQGYSTGGNVFSVDLQSTIEQAAADLRKTRGEVEQEPDGAASSEPTEEADRPAP